MSYSKLIRNSKFAKIKKFDIQKVFPGEPLLNLTTCWKNTNVKDVNLCNYINIFYYCFKRINNRRNGLKKLNSKHLRSLRRRRKMSSTSQEDSELSEGRKSYIFTSICSCTHIYTCG